MVNKPSVFEALKFFCNFFMSFFFFFQILSEYGTQWVQRIEDITDFVHEQKKILDESGPENIKVAKEIVYPLTNQSIAARIELDFDEPAQVVGFVS